ncbi:MAG: hypothetical protein V1722_02325 [Candidatus Micrarchaeota archaeon]
MPSNRTRRIVRTEKFTLAVKAPRHSNRTPDVVRVEEFTLAAKAPKRHGASWIKSEREACFKVAENLGETHKYLVELAVKGKRIKQIAHKLRLTPQYVSAMVKALDAQVRFYKKTGRMPGEREPTAEDWHSAKSLVHKLASPAYLCDRTRRNNATRAIALGLSGVMPVHPNTIYCLRRVVNANSRLFPEEIVQSVKVHLGNNERLRGIRHKVEQAAERGDEAAKKFLASYYDTRKNERYVSGCGLWRRHPDLVMGTALQPSFIKGIHPQSLATRKSIVNALAARSEPAGIAMKLLIAGKSRAEIARNMKLTPSKVTTLLTAGPSAVFGIPPAGNNATVHYFKLMRRHADVFQPKKTKTKDKQQLKEAA